MSQSQYSKLELGKTVISYNVLNELKNHGWDIDFIITGNSFSANKSEMTDYYDFCSGKEKVKFLELFCLSFISDEFAADDKVTEFEWRYLKYIVKNEIKKIQPFVILRDLHGYTQQDMADMLGVNIKKYRSLERGEVNPDAQLMVILYENMGCRPAVFTDNKNIIRVLIGDLCMAINEDRRKNVMKFIKDAIGTLG